MTIIKECKSQIKTTALKNCSRYGKLFDRCFCSNRKHCDDNYLKVLAKESIK